MFYCYCIRDEITKRVNNVKRVKFYSSTDLGSGYQCQLIEKKLPELDFNKRIDDVNDIIEFYNINLYIENKMYLKHWDKDFIEILHKLTPIINKTIAVYFNKISEDTFKEIVSDIDIEYQRDFLLLFCKYKVFKKIKGQLIQNAITHKCLPLYLIVLEKCLVTNYDEFIKEEFLKNPLNVELLLDKYLVLNDSEKKKEIYIPQSLRKDEINNLLEEYITSPDSNLNYLRLLLNALSTKDFEVSDEIKLKAKRRIKMIEKELFPSSSGIQFEFYVSLDPNQEEPVKQEYIKAKIDKSFSLKWFEENLDYPTILQNFIQLFEFVDRNMRISLVSNISEMTVLEQHIGIRSKKDYTFGINYDIKNTLSNIEINMYYDFLSKKNIKLEEVLEWFFTEYLRDEFGINDYRVKLPSPESTYREKCRDLLPEMESILKQFTLYVKFNEIDHELLQIGSSSTKIKDIPSKIKFKYVYGVKEKLGSLFYYFFSDQSGLSYIREDLRANTFYELLAKNKILLTDIPEYDRPIVNSLISNNYLIVNSDQHIEIKNPSRLNILSQLYQFETINYFRYPMKYRKEINDMVAEGLLTFGCTFFSVPEQKYMNFHLNKSEFSNGLDLRNQYSHGTQPNDPNEEFQHKHNYMVILKLLVLIIIKINDELCIKMDLLND
jgi:hypothetical protein